jgi:hypothetical protein
MSDEDPREPTLKDKHWTLCRALAWIVTRDIEKVRELASDAELVSLFMCVAFWRDDGVPLHSEPNAAWDLLAKRIAAGEVEAHGRAFENNLKIGKREPIGSVADGFALGDLYSEMLAFPGANLEDKHSSARIVDIVVRVRDLVSAFPAGASGIVVTKSKGGRPRAYDWDAAEAHAMELMEYHGLPSSTDAEFTQAQLEKMISAFLGEKPSESTVRDYVKKWMLKRLAEA